MTTPQKTYEELRDEAATDWCIDKGAYHFEHLAFESGADFARKLTLEECDSVLVRKQADRITVLLAERDALKAQCEKLANWLELIASPSAFNCEIGESNQRAAAQKALAEYRKSVGK